MRGDRPSGACSTRLSRRATPHARGSTWKPWRNQGALTGYPACAGIDLSIRLTAFCDSWLPRMRGDRPPVPETDILEKQATPHARGSTLLKEFSRRATLGYP